MDDYTDRKIRKAEALLKEGNYVSAHFAVRKVLRSNPNNVSALIAAAEISLRTGKRIEAMDLANQLFEQDLAAIDVTRQRRLGHICFESELYDLALRLFHWVRQKHQDDELVLYQGGLSLRRLGRMAEAEEWLLECIKRRPDVAEVYQELGHVCKATGQWDDAVDNYRKSIDIGPRVRGSGYWCLADLKNYVFSDDDVAAMESELASNQDEQQKSALNCALGWAAEQREDYAVAMDYYRGGNEIQSRLRPFPREHYRRTVTDLRALAGDHPPLEKGSTTPTAILIVGLPRSGTTLIEQILSAHPRVQATDELPFLDRIAIRLDMKGGYPRRLTKLTDEERRYLGQQYVNSARAYFKDDTDFFIDKYPGNFLHVGLMKRIMPDAIIIDSRRDPRDIAVSAYRQLFGQRGEFTSSFDDIYEYYNGYVAMMDHWRSIYPKQIVTQSYEKLVRSPDGEIRSLLEACGLEDAPACYEFYNPRRVVTTPSAAQVSKPLYTSSIGQGRRFEAFAKDEFDRLGALANNS